MFEHLRVNEIVNVTKCYPLRWKGARPTPFPFTIKETVWNSILFSIIEKSSIGIVEFEILNGGKFMGNCVAHTPFKSTEKNVCVHGMWCVNLRKYREYGMCVMPMVYCTMASMQWAECHYFNTLTNFWTTEQRRTQAVAQIYPNNRGVAISVISSFSWA